MELYNHFPLFIILLPMVLSLVMGFLRSEKAAICITLFVQIILTILSVLLLISLLNGSGKSFTYSLGYFPAPWGNELRAGPFEALMSCVFALVMFFSVLGGAGDSVQDIHKGKIRYFYLMINLLSASLMALIFTNDIFSGYVFIEINTLAACAIVVAKESGDTVKATIKYMFLSVLGSGLFFLSISFLYGITGHLLMESAHNVIAELAAAGQYRLPLVMTLALFSISLAVKSALFPFHAWLPDAHGYATTSASAILSGIVLKGYIIMLIKMVSRVYGIEVVGMLGIMPALFTLGLVSMIAGSIFALMQKDIKRMIAYSSVAHIGYIFMGIGLNTAAGFAAAGYHLVAHAFTKSMLFIAVGPLMHTAGSGNIDGMRGVAKKNALAGAAFVVGALSLIGIPFFAGFPSKFYLASAALLQEGQSAWIAVIVLVLSTFLNALYYVPTLYKLYSGGGTPEIAEKTAALPAGKGMKLLVAPALICLIVANIALGVVYVPLLDALERGFALL